MRPVYAQPGYIPADTHLILASGQFAFADCYTIFPRYGDPIYLTTATRSFTVVPVGGVSPVLFQSRPNLQVKGLRLNIGTGSDVDEQDMEVNYDHTATGWGVPFGRALRQGRLDGATISRDRYFRKDWKSPIVGGTPLFRGRISTVDRISRISAVVKVKSELVLLNVRMPVDLYQPGCTHTLYDPGCTLDKEDFKNDATVGASSTAQTLNWSGAAARHALGMIYIDAPLGEVTLVRTIQSVVPGVSIRLAYPLDFVPTPGTAFETYEGCSRTYERCGQFNNRQHFKGFPYIPVAETSL